MARASGERSALVEIKAVDGTYPLYGDVVLDPAMPLHVTRFFPRHRMQDRPPTPVARVLHVDRDRERRSVQQLLAFVASLPIRHSGEWSRDDLYE